MLNVSKGASQNEIKMAYFAMAKEYHPDVNDSPEAEARFAAANTAYETLGDPDSRRIYDSTGMGTEEQAQTEADPFSSGFDGKGPHSGHKGYSDIFEDFENMFQGKGKGRGGRNTNS